MPSFEEGAHYRWRGRGDMGRNWNGFAAQNELIKLQWAALESVQAEVPKHFIEMLLEEQQTDESDPAEEDGDNPIIVIS